MENRLQVLRWERNLSQQELADKSGVSKSTIGGIENGRVKNPSVKNAVYLAKALGVDVTDIFYEEGEQDM